jgi:hypothetical protein
LGRRFEHPNVDSIQFRSTLSLLDYDLAIIDLAGALLEYRTEPFAPTYMGLRCLDDDDSVNLKRDIARRRSEILEMVQLGRQVVVITPPPTTCYVATGKREFSGTGRNRQTTRLIAEKSLLDTIPAKFTTREARGSALQFVGPQSFAPFWKRNRSHLVYRAVFDDPPGQPILEVTGTGKVVSAFVLEPGGGVLLFLPDIDDSALGVSASRRANREYIDGLMESLAQLHGPSEALPDWSAEFFVPGERVNAADLQAVEGDVATLLIRRDEVQLSLERLRSMKYLVTGTGAQLERVVRLTFERLGAIVDEAPSGRSDLRLRFGNVRAVVEVKGKAGSAAEADAAQLEKWVATELEISGAVPKGILVVNAFRDRPLRDRNQPVFPDQMLPYSLKRGHCLIAGWQLLAAYVEAEGNPEAVDSIVSELLATEGQFARYADWQQALETADKAAVAVDVPPVKSGGDPRGGRRPAAHRKSKAG